MQAIELDEKLRPQMMQGTNLQDKEGIHTGWSSSIKSIYYFRHRGAHLRAKRLQARPLSRKQRENSSLTTLTIKNISWDYHSPIYPWLQDIY